MLSSGEDPRFICRRLAILASEDVGLASPQALQMAAAAWTITERIGMPECQLTLSELVLYLATCPKSDSSAQAIWTAMKDVSESRSQAVPLDLRSGPNPTHGSPAKNYVNPHRDPEHAPDQDYLSSPRSYFTPGTSGFEAEVSRRLEQSDTDEPS